MPQARYVVAFDVDGTLLCAGGGVSAEQLAHLNCPDVVWGILSSRSVEGSKGACDTLGMEPAFIENCRVDMRAEELLLLMVRFPDADRYIYVADRDVDRQEALRAGWEFVFHHRFGELLEEIV